ncbi:MAG TPA: zinc ribbon domain-containing protein [Bacteroidetes bacterium]|nr:zinc ribbon domain-containing protein [Bacteroidota bacterium]
MPTYTYRCTVCGHTFDLFHSVSDNGGKRCPECGAAAERQIGRGAGLIFKGSGFYITDYKHDHSSPPGGNGNGRTATEKKVSGEEKSGAGPGDGGKTAEKKHEKTTS